MSRCRPRRCGFALLETLIALAIISIAGLAFVELAAQSLRSIGHARDVEERIADQDRLLAAYTLLDRRDLGRRVGGHRVGEYTVSVQRLDLNLFRIGIGAPGAQADLSTVVYRPGALQ